MAICEISRKGICIAVIKSEEPNAVESWVQKVAGEANAKLDWRHLCGAICVLHLGNEKSKERSIKAIKKLEKELDGQVLSIDGVSREGNTCKASKETHMTNAVLDLITA